MSNTLIGLDTASLSPKAIQFCRSGLGVSGGGLT